MKLQGQRKTRETSITLVLNTENVPDGSSPSHGSRINTGLRFFDHMLEQLAFHAGWRLQLEVSGDVDVDDHHSIEDVAIVLGDVLCEWRRQRPQANRYGQRLLPMDATLVWCAVDLDGRGSAVIQLPFSRESVGSIACEMWPHFFQTLSRRGQFSLHLKTEYFDNNHHLIEAAFKACARALREAYSLGTGDDRLDNKPVNSSKGVL